jgi:hypothetical protein
MDVRVGASKGREVAFQRPHQVGKAVVLTINENI